MSLYKKYIRSAPAVVAGIILALLPILETIHLAGVAHTHSCSAGAHFVAIDQSICSVQTSSTQFLSAKSCSPHTHHGHHDASHCIFCKIYASIGHGFLVGDIVSPVLITLFTCSTITSATGIISSSLHYSEASPRAPPIRYWNS